MTPSVQILTGDCRGVLPTLPSESVQCCVTSPPYWGLRDYGHADQIGREPTPDIYVETMRAVFSEVWRVLKKDGTLWLNLGDCYASAWSVAGDKGRPIGAGSLANGKRAARPNRLVGGLKEKDLIGIPWRVAFALQADGWFLRSDIVWNKPAVMPESVTDRPTRSHEFVFLFAKSSQYYYDHEAIKEPCAEASIERAEYGWNGRTADSKGALTVGARSGSTFHKIKSGEADMSALCPAMRNKRDVWTIPPASYRDAHFATYPPDLVKPCVMAGTKAGDTVLDPFGGSGTTGEVALDLGRSVILIELNPEYVSLIERRTNITPGMALV